MKKLSLLIIAIIGLSFQSNAQIEVTTNPIGYFAGTYISSVDYELNSDWSVGGDLAISSEKGGFSVFYVNAKHYINPLSKNQKFYIGTFLGSYTRSKLYFSDRGSN